jgi:hypothetical protein
MGGDYTRFTFKAKKNYSGVLKQQGRVSLDADLNELFEITDRRWRSETLDIIGHCVVPISTPDGFRVIPTGSGTFDIGIGRAYVDGIQAECHGLDPQRYDAVLGEKQGTSPVPYSDQPHLPAPLPPSLTRSVLPSITGRTDLIYLDVFQREVTVIEDPDIKEIALGGPDTTTRVQTAWQVKALADVGDVSCSDEIPDWENIVSPSAGWLTTGTYTPPPDDNPCIISAAGGYHGIENRLYRVEIHTKGLLGTAKFKWSRNNASIVSEVETISEGDQITVRSIGRDQTLRFNIGDWIEIRDDHLEFQGLAGHPARIVDIDEANRILTINNPISASLNLDASHAARHTRVIRWDQQSVVDTAGLLDVTAGPIDIEDGIQVWFSLDPAISSGEFKVGDYWVFHARTADGSVELLQNAPPRGIKHHYCQLALVTWGADVESTFVRDCRTLWPPAKCCPIAVRPGEDIQAAINRVPEEGGCVCLLPGTHQIYKPLFVDGRKNITLTGVGTASKLVFSSIPTGDATQSLLYVVGASHNIEIKEMLVHADSLEHLVFVDEACEDVSINDVVLINGLTQQDSHSDCVLLGECCNVTIDDCKMVGYLGVVQAGSKTLERARTALAALRPSEKPAEEAEGEAEGEANAAAGEEKPGPLLVSTLQELHVHKSCIFFAEIGIQLQDVLSGNIEKNRLNTMTPDRLDPFRRPPVQAAPPEDFYATLEDSLAALSVCPGPAQAEGEEEAGEEGTGGDEQGETPEIPEETVGVSACLIEDFDIRYNRIRAGGGLAFQCSRCVRSLSNRFVVSRVGIAFGYGFDNEINDNDIRMITPDNLAEEEQQSHGPDTLWRRNDSGDAAISLRFVRGIQIRENHIQAHTAIATGSYGMQKCSGYQHTSVLRILGIERPWRAFIELFWFIYQLFSLLSSGETSGAPAGPGAVDTDVAQTRKEQLELRMFNRFYAFLFSHFMPYFIGKAEISDNRMMVSRFGVFLYKIFSISGLRIMRNRISGFQKAGIFVRPWYSVGFVDKFARSIRCLITWIIAFLTMLRDALRDFLEDEQPSEQPEAGITGILAQSISRILVLCSRYCGGAAPPEGEEGEGEQPPSLAEVLVDALDDFLDHVRLQWLDDLVNQAYDIDRNVLTGSGDGIWTGMDGSRITNNKVTIWPASTVPYETMVIGILLRQHFENLDTPYYSYYSDEVEFLAESAMELDRDLVFMSVFGASGWLEPNLGAAQFRGHFREFLSELAIYVDSSSPIMEQVTAMQEGLVDENHLDLPKVQDAWSALLIIMGCDLRGYGIAMRGANMECRGNHVEAKTGCRSLLPEGNQDMPNIPRSAPALNLPWGRQAMFESPGIGGIWQFSNTGGLLIDFLEIFFRKREGWEYIYQLIIWFIFYRILFTEEERTISVNENTVHKALVHGIRTMEVAGLEEVNIYDNTVRDASRHGIYHSVGIFGMFDEGVHAEGVHAKVHRNTVIHSQGSSAFSRLQGAGDEFSSLIYVDNEEGTTLMSHNHGDGEGLAGQERAVYTESEVIGISANHILTDADSAFEVHAKRGLFTDNITNKSNNVSPSDIVQGLDVTNL